MERFLSWHRSSNFGDLLSPWIFNRITGENPVHVSLDQPGWSITGSLLGPSMSAGVVWGCGAASLSDMKTIHPPSSRFRIIATRGPISEEYARQAGHRPIAFCDPGFLMPRWIEGSKEKDIETGFSCSWVDYDLVKGRFPGYHVINMNSSVEDGIREISRCRRLVSTTLHGFIMAVAYNVECALVDLDGSRMVGDGIKFDDTLALLEVEGYHRARISGPSGLADADFRIFDHPYTRPLWNCCPFRPLVDR